MRTQDEKAATLSDLLRQKGEELRLAEVPKNMIEKGLHDEQVCPHMLHALVPVWTHILPTRANPGKIAALELQLRHAIQQSDLQQSLLATARDDVKRHVEELNVLKSVPSGGGGSKPSSVETRMLRANLADAERTIAQLKEEVDKNALAATGWSPLERWISKESVRISYAERALVRSRSAADLRFTIRYHLFDSLNLVERDWSGLSNCLPHYHLYLF